MEPATGEKKNDDQVNDDVPENATTEGDDNANCDKEKASARGQVNDDVLENVKTGGDDNPNSDKEKASGSNDDRNSDSIVADDATIDQGQELDKNIPNDTMMNNKDGSAKCDSNKDDNTVPDPAIRHQDGDGKGNSDNTKSDNIVADGERQELDKNVPKDARMNNKDGNAKRHDGNLIQAQSHNYPANNRSVLYYHMEGNYFINIPIEPITPAVNTRGQCNSITDGSAIQESTQVDHVANKGIVAAGAREDDASRINNDAPRKTFKIFRDNLALTLRTEMCRRDGSSSSAELLPNLDNFHLQHSPDSVQLSTGNDPLAAEDSKPNSTGNVQPPESEQGTTTTAGTSSTTRGRAGAGKDISMFRRSDRIKQKEGKK